MQMHLRREREGEKEKTAAAVYQVQEAGEFRDSA